MIAALPFGPGGLAFIALYLLSLLAIGWWGRRARQADTLQDFYLAGPGIGFVVLLLTLYATQWSGNTLFGYTGKAYNEGFSWLVSLHFMTALVVCYLFFAPWLHRLAKRHEPLQRVRIGIADRAGGYVLHALIIGGAAGMRIAMLIRAD